MIKLKNIRESKLSKGVSVLLTILMIEPTCSYALTSGPTQPEFQKFGTGGNSGLVDPFTGNVNYSIPLLDIGGYPITLAYSGDISPEADAGWVGLGWNLQAGAITRALRGIPDDFNGDKIVSKIYEKPHETYSVNFNPHLSDKAKESSAEQVEIFGIKARFGFDFDFTLSFDNYKGVGIGYNLNPFIRNITNGGDSSSTLIAKAVDSIMSSNMSDSVKNLKVKAVITEGYKKYISQPPPTSARIGLNLNYNSYSGLSVGPKGQIKNVNKTPLISLIKTDIAYSSREGLVSSGFSLGYGKLSNTIRSNTYADPFLIKQSVFPYDLNRVNTNIMGSFSYANRSVLPNARAISIMVMYNRSNYAKNGEYVQKPAYGFFNLNSSDDVNALHDYSENPQQIDEQEKNSAALNLASYHQDYFNISANGIGGSVKAILNSLPIIGPNQVSVTPSFSGKLKAELAIGSTGFELGVDLGLALNSEKHERWRSNSTTSLLHYLNVKGTLLNSPFSKYAFRNQFEFIEQPASFYSQQLGSSLMQVPITMGFGKLLPAKAKNNFKTSTYTSTINSEIFKNQREASQQVVTKLLASEAAKYGLIKKIEDYAWESNGQPTLEQDLDGKHILSKSEITRNADDREDHHLSEFNVIQPDGTRYVFGIPVYSKMEYEYNFNTRAERTKNYLKRTVNFTPSDMDVDNNNGISEFFSFKNTTDYAHAFLLSAYLSPDYVDVTGNGPSPDDLGGYVKFNYGKQSSNDYQWKSPWDANKADYNIGIRADADDDMGSFSYGEKELWYMHSIETKDRIVFFQVLPRYDGLGVSSVYGGGPSTSVRQQYLSKIIMFSRPDFEKNGYAFAKPLKIIDFGYSYDLCDGVPNWNKPGGSPNIDHPLKELNASQYNSYWDVNHGKLTLNRIKVYYGDKESEITTNYYFEYKGYNPDYVYKSVNRWGVYTPINLFSGSDASDNPETMGLADCPYVPQDRKADVDSWSRAWMMSDITLPSGGTIHFEYESDDYAYVQDRQAMQMLNLYGVNDDNNASVEQGLVKLQSDIKDPKDYIYFKKPTGMGQVNASEFFEKNETKLLYFNACMRLGRAADGLTYNYIPGFCEVDSYGDRIIGTDSLVYIKIKHYNIRKREKKDPDKNKVIHPFVKMAIQYGLSQTQHLFYPGSNLRKDSRFSENGKTSRKMAKVATAILGIFPELQRMFTEESKYFIGKNVGNHIVTDRSFIRVLVPTMKKMGGGHRVKKVSITDNWNRFTGGVENSSTYSILYDYTMMSKDSNLLISSGVASYEPIAGGDENPFKIPIDIQNMLKRGKQGRGPLSISYDLAPIGEEFYPGPSIGYRKVTIRNEVPDEDIIRHRAGRTELEFYTSYDFPTSSDKTNIQYMNPRFANPLGADLSSNMIGRKGGRDSAKMQDKSGENKKKKMSFDLGISVKFSRAGASQGFIIELNDMHGKPKAEWIYGEESSTYISGTEYFYKTDGSGRLLNDITVLRPDGTFAQTKAGEKIETVIYASRYVKRDMQLNAQLDINTIQPPPTAPVPSLAAQLVLNKLNNRLITVTKLIHRIGIIDSVVFHDKGATRATHNVAWDALTGQVLLSSTKNEYGDKVYKLTKPAYWMYPGMAGAFSNIETDVELSDGDSDGFPEIPNNLLFPGDELIDINGTEKYWVLDTLAGEAALIDADGNPQVPTGTILRIIRSGHRNILNVLAEEVMMQGNPLNQVDNAFTGPYEKVITASGNIYNDVNQLLFKDHICFTAECGDSSDYEDVIFARDSLTELGILLSHYSTYLNNYGYSPIDTNTTIYSFPYNNNYNATVEFVNCGGGELGGLGVGQTEVCDNLVSKNPGNRINPFFYGIRGIWRPFGAYVYNEKRDSRQQRTQAITGNDLNTTRGRTSGFINTFREFWYWDGSKWHPRIYQSKENPWTWKDSATYIDNYGNSLEYVNTSSIYSSSLYGFNRRFPIATAKNARYKEILYEGFEEIDVNTYYDVLCSKAEPNAPDYPSYGATWGEDICEHVRHWPIEKALLGTKNRISNKYAHTGYHSLKLHHGITEVKLNDTLALNTPAQSFGSFILGSDNFAPKLYPINGKTYVVSLWVMESWNNQFSFVLKDGLGNTLTLSQDEKPVVINGWKKLAFRFTPVSNSPLVFQFINRAPIIDDRVFCYLDDIRLFPADAEMESYVYDKLAYKIMATLDRNNFAHFYEYDAEGKLIRKKVETERGIMTIQEQRSSLRKQ